MHIADGQKDITISYYYNNLFRPLLLSVNNDNPLMVIRGMGMSRFPYGSVKIL